MFLTLGPVESTPRKTRKLKNESAKAKSIPRKSWITPIVLGLNPTYLQGKSVAVEHIWPQAPLPA